MAESNKNKSKKDSSIDKEEIKESKNEFVSRKIIKPVISFDNYFAKLLSEDPKVQPHHKAPMRAFAEQNQLTSGTLEDFKRLFRLY